MQSTAAQLCTAVHSISLLPFSLFSHLFFLVGRQYIIREQVVIQRLECVLVLRALERFLAPSENTCVPAFQPLENLTVDLLKEK
jgi:hypothetical protein